MPTSPVSRPSPASVGSPPGRRRPQEGQDAQQPVEAHLDHHARHQGGHVRRGGRVRFGQPDVERNETRLGPEADQGEHEDQPGPTGGEGRHGAKRLELQAAGVAAQAARRPGMRKATPRWVAIR